MTPVELYEYEDQWGLAHYEDQWGLAFERLNIYCLSGYPIHVQRGCKVRYGDCTWLITRAIQSVIHSNLIRCFMNGNFQIIGLYEANKMIISNESDVQVEELFHVIRKMSRWLDCFENEIIFVNESKVLMKQLFLKGNVLIKESLWKFWEVREIYKIMRCKKMISLESIVFLTSLKTFVLWSKIRSYLSYYVE